METLIAKLQSQKLSQVLSLWLKKKNPKTKKTRKTEQKSVKKFKTMISALFLKQLYLQGYTVSFEELYKKFDLKKEKRGKTHPCIYYM